MFRYSLILILIPLIAGAYCNPVKKVTRGHRSPQFVANRNAPSPVFTLEPVSASHTISDKSRNDLIDTKMRAGVALALSVASEASKSGWGDREWLIVAFRREDARDNKKGDKSVVSFAITDVLTSDHSPFSKAHNLESQDVYDSGFYLNDAFNASSNPRVSDKRFNEFTRKLIANDGFVRGVDLFHAAANQLESGRKSPILSTAGYVAIQLHGEKPNMIVSLTSEGGPATQIGPDTTVVRRVTTR